ncbi:MAG: YdcF family protein [Lachnospiraceae bacterium]|nr:YdcF family protein [Lachnospiraceae bacterium]
MTVKILMIIGIMILLPVLIISFKKRPFACVNIFITSVLLFLLSLITPPGVLFVPVSVLCLFMCVSDISLILHEGFRRKFIPDLIFSFVYPAASYFLRVRGDLLAFMPLPFLTFLRLLLNYGECIILAICIMGYAVLKIKPGYDKDFVIILGCSVSRKGMLRPLIKDRTNRAMRFVWEQEWKNNKSALYVPSGGQGSDEPISEGSAMALYLLSHGAEDEEVIAEKRSRNTLENLLFSKYIIDGIKKDAKIAVVTNNFHVLRSGMLAFNEGIDADLIGCSTVWYFWPNAFFREMIAILFYCLRAFISFFL